MKKIYAALLLTGCALLCASPVLAGQTLEGDANVDQRNYPSTSPFVHPPFYNVKVTVELDDDGVITAVSDNGTGKAGSVMEGNEEFWEKKNKPYFDTAVNGGLFEKFTGKTLEEVKEMDMTGVDAISGATMVSAACQEAVINAIEGKAGKTFLDLEGPALTLKDITDNTVTFTSNLPEDFDLALLDIRWGVYNQEVIPAESYSCEISDGKMTLSFTDLSAQKAGYYYVNVTDQSNTYRSPSFEGGPANAQAPYFILDSGLEQEDLSFDGKAVVLSSGDISDYLKNIQHVEILKEGDTEPTVQEPVGHHGTAGNFIALDSEGVLNADGIVQNRDGSEFPLFEEGESYTVTIEAFGYPSLSFAYSR